MRLKGKVALVTGAAMGHSGELMGIGGASARLFATEGARVVVADVKEADGNRTAAEIREAGHEATFVRLDVTSANDWAVAVNAAVEAYGRLDVLVNCAGTAVGGGVEETTVELWNDQMNVHAKGTFLGTKHSIPEMIGAGGGSVVNISSIDGITANPQGQAYSAAKGAIRILTKQTAIEFAGKNIRANSVHPGYTDTPLSRSGLRRLTEQGLPDPRLPKVPLGRLASAREIAYGVLFLASDEASFVTGAELVIDGGVTAQ